MIIKDDLEDQPQSALGKSSAGFDDVQHQGKESADSNAIELEWSTEFKIACNGGNTHFFGPASKVAIGEMLELENATTVPASPNAIRVLHKRQQIGWIHFKHCASVKRLISSLNTGTDIRVSYCPMSSSHPAVLITFLHKTSEFVDLIKSLNGVSTRVSIQ